jgi:hypothetical protein
VQGLAVSTVTTRNHLGFLRTHSDGSTRRPFHSEQRPQPMDRERIAVIRAARELVALEIIFAHLDLSGIAQTRVDDALRALYRALDLRRDRLGMTCSAHHLSTEVLDLPARPEAVSYTQAVAATMAMLGLDQHSKRSAT